MKALLIVAHGSRKQKSNNEIAALAEKTAEISKQRFNIVDYAFMQFARPLFGETIDSLVKKGAEKIVVFPLFVGAGSHVITDIPEAIDNAKKKHPRIEITKTAHLGEIDILKELIFSEAQKY